MIARLRFKPEIYGYKLGALVPSHSDEHVKYDTKLSIPSWVQVIKSLKLIWLLDKLHGGAPG
jgi:hypothetical protein